MEGWPAERGVAGALDDGVVEPALLEDVDRLVQPPSTHARTASSLDLLFHDIIPRY